MHEKDFLPGQKPPIEILPVHHAWSKMKKKLDDETPAAIVITESPGKKQKGALSRPLRNASLLLLLLLITTFFIYRLNEQYQHSERLTTNQENEASNDKSSDKPMIEATIDGNLKTDDPIPGQQENKSAEVTSSENEKNANEQGNKVKSNKQVIDHQSVDNIITQKKSSGKQEIKSKKQKAKNKMAEGAVITEKEKERSIDNSKSGEMQILTQGGLTQANKISDSANQVKAKNSVRKDSSNATPIPEENIPDYKPVVSVGLQWNFQVPVYSADSYFKGPAATSQPYAVLLPGVWLTVMQDQHILRAELNPFYSNLLPPRSFGTFTTYSNAPDTIVIATETRTLRKTFGIHLSADYNYNISGNWWAGGGIHASWVRKGVASANGTEERRSISNGGVATNSINRAYTLSKTDLDNFARFQIGINAETNYITKKMETGLRIGLPITPVAKHNGQKNSIRTEVIFRLPLFSSTRKMVN